MSASASASASRPSTRPRTRSMLSFASGKSHKSSGSQHKIDLRETSAEKDRGRLKSKADPTLAMSEEEPASLAAGGETNLEPLRAIQHRDADGNIIADPDRSNPTRSRWERPLDTIRSFEAAIDGKYTRRTSSQLPGPRDAFNPSSRRSSYHQGYDQSSRRPTPDQGYHSNRIYQSRPESYVDGPPTAAPHGPYRSRLPPRMTPDPMRIGPPRPNHAIYPTSAYQRSYDTVTSASGTVSNLTDTWATSTDPSSENSSVDRVAPIPPPPPPKPDLGEVYGFTGFGETPPIHPHRFADPAPTTAGAPSSTGTNGSMIAHDPSAPPVPPHLSSKDEGRGGRNMAIRMPIVNLGGASSTTSSSSPPFPRSGSNTSTALSANASAGRPGPGGEKRKSWFKRFSKG